MRNMRPSVLTIAVATSTTVLVSAVLWKLRFRYRQKDEHDNDNGHSNAGYDKDEHEHEHPSRREIQLPAHLERELHKEDRRQKMIPLLTMDRPMYDNILMKDPDDNLLCTIALKKANWYVKKNLAFWKDDKKRDCIKLLFRPDIPEQKQQELSADSDNDNTHNNNTMLNMYNQTVKANCCVVCGHDQDYMRHYVIPFCYRTLFPESYKTHLPHDIVLVCSKHHVTAGKKYFKRMKKIEDALRTDPETAPPELLDKRVHQIQSSAKALLHFKDKMPLDRIAAYESLLCEWYELPQPQETETSTGNSDDDTAATTTTAPTTLTTAQLQTASELESRRPNPKFISGPTLVMESLKNDDEAMGAFVREWRSFFFDTMQPQFLPTGWSVDSPVQCDTRKAD
jgi:hypothetical protein